MDAGASDRERILEARVSALEHRLEDVEARLATGAPAPEAVPPAPAPAIVSLHPIGAPAWIAPDTGPTVQRPSERLAAADAWPAAPTAAEPEPSERWQAPRSSMPVANLGQLVEDLEERLTGRALAWVGGAALILGAIFFISLAFSRGWIGHEGQVAIGLLAGALAIAAGGFLLERGERLVGTVLTPVGLAIVSISLVGATRLYGLVPTELGLAGALLSAVAVAVIAVRVDSQVVAGFGLVTVLASPPLVGASPDLSTLGFVGVALVGTTIVALLRTWSWLPPIAFLLSAPQAAVWFAGEPSVPIAFVALAAFWGIHAVAAGGEEFRRRRDDLRSSSAGLLLADAAFLVWAGFTLLSGDLEPYRGTFLLVVTLAHLGLGGYFIVRDGERHLFGLLSMGTGIAALTMAVPVQLGGPPVPIAWTAEAAALAWVASLRHHPFSLATSGVLFTLAASHLVLVEYPLPVGAPADVPFLDERGAALAFFLVGLAVAVAVLPERRPRSWAVALGLLVTSLAIGSELRGIPVVAAWSAVAVAGAAIWKALPRLPERPVGWTVEGLVPSILRPGVPTGELSDVAVPAMSGLAGLLAVGHATSVELPVASFGQVFPPAIPFTGDGALTAAILIVATLACTAVVGGRLAWRVGLIATGAILAYTIPYEVYAWAVAVLWSALGVAGFGLAVVDAGGRRPFLVAGGLVLAAAALVAVGIVGPPTRLVAEAMPSFRYPVVTGETVAALGSVAVALAALAWLHRAERWARWAEVGAGAVVVYLLSVAIVDTFSAQVGGPVALEELQKQGQVALSVLWTIGGVVGFVGGLVTRRLELRQGGLGLLALATAKVFLVDLSSLDVAYRVISLIALGVLLLGSAWMYGRLRPKGPTATPRGPRPVAHGAGGGP